MIKKIIKKLLPRKFHAPLKEFEVALFGLERGYSHLSAEEVFDKVYQEGAWGKDRNGFSTSGSGSHTESIVAPYVEAVGELVKEVSPKTAVDLGCGDFHVGSKIYSFFESYIACDISSVILERNRKIYGATSLQFRKFDLAKDDPPHVDIAFVRQVLQHLSNQDIGEFVRRINDGRPFKYLMVTEHLPFDPAFTPNIDKPSGPQIRVALNSGVVLHKAPFDLRYIDFRDILVVEEDVSGKRAIIKSTLYTLR